MSQAKLAAAKELIQEKRYAEARVLLNTVNHPIASRWLEQLDSIAPQSSVVPRPPNSMIPPPPPTPAQYYTAPPPVSFEADRYYRAENRKRNRRRIGNGIEIIVMGLGCIGAGIYVASLPKYVIPGSPPPDNGLSQILLVGGVICLLAGTYLIRRD